MPRSCAISVEGYVDRLLDGAQLQPGMTLVDIGTGEGVVPLRAIERVGETLRVILTDVSAPMLNHTRTRFAELSLDRQCSFIECPAEDPSLIPDASVDAVTTRAVLAYVADKHAALGEFMRILKPGGRISLCEPVLQDEALYARVLKKQIESEPRPDDRFLRLLHRWKAAQYPDTEEECAKWPHVNYSERDLLTMVHRAGFTALHLEFHIDVKPSQVVSWEVFLGVSPHPWAPSLKTILAQKFSPEERQFFESVLRPTIESGGYTVTDKIVYITAAKPLSTLPAV